MIAAEPKRMTEDRKSLAERYRPLAMRIAFYAARAFPRHLEDFRGEALLGLVEAAAVFDPARKVKFSTFARYRIEGRIRDYQRRELPFGWRQTPADAPGLEALPHDPERYGRIVGIAYGEPIGADTDDLDAIEAQLRRLPPRHAKLCRLIHINGYTQTEAARALGVSQSRLSAVYREAMAILSGEWAARIKGAA